MIQLVKGQREISLQELYDAFGIEKERLECNFSACVQEQKKLPEGKFDEDCGKENDPLICGQADDCSEKKTWSDNIFKKYVMDMISSDQLHYIDSKKVAGLEEYRQMRISDRKEKIKAQVMAQYGKSIQQYGKNKRKSLRKEYKQSEEYRLSCQNLYSSDDMLKQLEEGSLIDALYEKYLTEKKKESLAQIEFLLEDFLRGERLKKIEALDVEAIFEGCFTEIRDQIQQMIEDTLLVEKVEVRVWEREEDDYYWNAYYGYRWIHKELTEENLEEFLEGFCNDSEAVVADFLGKEDFIDSYLLDRLFELSPELNSLSEEGLEVSEFWEVYDGEVDDFKREMVDDLDLSSAHILECLAKNPRYSDIATSFYERRKRQLEEAERARIEAERLAQEKRMRETVIKRSILSSIPEDYKDLYPLARQKRRKFILHIGPTNSGKTYSAMSALRKNGSGIYLAPLRLLAYEQFESLNKDGFYCDLITGEEKTRIPFATYQSSTIEVVDLTKAYSMAVIDEGQMIADEDRGGAWTSAILGLCADEIHICSADHAEDILKRLIKECGDSYDVVYHKRDTQLVMEKERFSFPKDVRPKDALIVFSKKNVHAVAATLQKAGKKCSIIYGNLPYNVRQEQAQKFLSGETEILVSTDAIGMGMNLPIQRIVFLETQKYDGRTSRTLKPEEIQQISGRAGRRGIYEIGLVNAAEQKNVVKSGLGMKVTPIVDAVIAFPESLLGIDAPLSEILQRWNQLKTNIGYRKGNIEDQIKLCQLLEQFSGDKRLIYDFITVPFDCNNDVLKNIWLTFFKDEMAGRPCNYRRFLPEVYDDGNVAYLNELEANYKICDLLYFYMDRFHGKEDFGDISEVKQRISNQIIKILKKQKLIPKKCKKCGQTLPWNHAYSICQLCYHRRRRDYGYYDDWYDFGDEID